MIEHSLLEKRTKEHLKLSSAFSTLPTQIYPAHFAILSHFDNLSLGDIVMRMHP
jgi:hypothetical protein